MTIVYINNRILNNTKYHIVRITVCEEKTSEPNNIQ